VSAFARVLLGTTSLLVALLLVIFFYPHDVHGAFFVRHDHLLPPATAHVLSVLIPLAALGLLGLAVVTFATSRSPDPDRPLRGRP
jgi:hypothetical protein